MAKLVAVTACPTSIAHTLMAAEALRRVADLKGHELSVESLGAEGVRTPLDEAVVAQADAVILATDITVDESRFQGKPRVRTSTAVAILETERIIDEAAAHATLHTKSPATEPSHQAGPLSSPTEPSRETVIPEGLASPEPSHQATTTTRTLVAVTACPTGIAHTFMAAEALTRAARARGYSIRVETQGSVGAKNPLTPEEIAQADAVIIGADTHVSTERFVGKRLLRTSVGEALKQADRVVEQALALPSPKSMTPPRAEPTGAYKHLLTGVSFMIPFAVAGGLLLALSFAFGIDADQQSGALPVALKAMSDAAFALMVPALAGYLAYSIADRPGLAPGFIGGMLANQLQAGFLGGIAAGFLAGFVARTLRDHLRLPRHLEGLKPVLVLPLLSTLIVGLLMFYVVGAPVAALMSALTRFLHELSGPYAVLLGLLLGAMMACDSGGPINKAAYFMGVGLLGSNTFTPMAAVMAAGMTPPLGIALATVVAKRRFTLQEREAGKATAVQGLAFTTEGAIPYAARDPLRVIPSTVFGSAIAGAVSMGFGCTLRTPHGGIFVLAIPHAVQPLGPYVLALVAGTLATTLGLVVLKRPVSDSR